MWIKTTITSWLIHILIISAIFLSRASSFPQVETFDVSPGGNGQDGQYDPVNDGGWDIRLSVPGEPERDYPTLNIAPVTSFNCNGKSEGYYADIEARCQAFRVCAITAPGGFFSFLCPNGTLFNQEVLVCDWWMNVKCPETNNYLNSNERIVMKAGDAMMADIKEMIMYPVTHPYREILPPYQQTMQIYSPPDGMFDLQIPNEGFNGGDISGNNYQNTEGFIQQNVQNEKLIINTDSYSSETGGAIGGGTSQFEGVVPKNQANLALFHQTENIENHRLEELNQQKVVNNNEYQQEIKITKQQFTYPSQYDKQYTVNVPKIPPNSNQPIYVNVPINLPTVDSSKGKVVTSHQQFEQQRQLLQQNAKSIQSLTGLKTNNFQQSVSKTTSGFPSSVTSYQSVSKISSNGIPSSQLSYQRSEQGGNKVDTSQRVQTNQENSFLNQVNGFKTTNQYSSKFSNTASSSNSDSGANSQTSGNEQYTDGRGQSQFDQYNKQITKNIEQTIETQQPVNNQNDQYYFTKYQTSSIIEPKPTTYSETEYRGQFYSSQFDQGRVPQNVGNSKGSSDYTNDVQKSQNYNVQTKFGVQSQTNIPIQETSFIPNSNYHTDTNNAEFASNKAGGNNYSNSTLTTKVINNVQNAAQKSTFVNSQIQTQKTNTASQFGSNIQKYSTQSSQQGNENTGNLASVQQQVPFQVLNKPAPFSRTENGQPYQKTSQYSFTSTTSNSPQTTFSQNFKASKSQGQFISNQENNAQQYVQNNQKSTSAQENNNFRANQQSTTSFNSPSPFKPSQQVSFVARQQVIENNVASAPIRTSQFSQQSVSSKIPASQNVVSNYRQTIQQQNSQQKQVNSGDALRFDLLQNNNVKGATNSFQSQVSQRFQNGDVPSSTSYNTTIQYNSNIPESYRTQTQLTRITGPINTENVVQNNQKLLNNIVRTSNTNGQSASSFAINPTQQTKITSSQQTQVYKNSYSEFDQSPRPIQQYTTNQKQTSQNINNQAQKQTGGFVTKNSMITQQGGFQNLNAFQTIGGQQQQQNSQQALGNKQQQNTYQASRVQQQQNVKQISENRPTQNQNQNNYYQQQQNQQVQSQQHQQTENQQQNNYQSSQQQLLNSNVLSNTQQQSQNHQNNFQSSTSASFQTGGDQQNKQNLLSFQQTESINFENPNTYHTISSQQKFDHDQNAFNNLQQVTSSHNSNGYQNQVLQTSVAQQYNSNEDQNTYSGQVTVVPAFGFDINTQREREDYFAAIAGGLKNVDNLYVAPYKEQATIFATTPVVSTNYNDKQIQNSFDQSFGTVSTHSNVVNNAGYSSFQDQTTYDTNQGMRVMNGHVILGERQMSTASLPLEDFGVVGYPKQRPSIPFTF